MSENGEGAEGAGEGQGGEGQGEGAEGQVANQGAGGAEGTGAEGAGGEGSEGGSQDDGGSQAAGGEQTLDVGAVLGSKEWLKHVPAEHLTAASKYGSLPEFMKAHGELSSKLGEALFIPGKDASDDDRGKFFDRLGRPKAAEDYELPEIEGEPFNEEAAAEFFQAAHGTGLTQKQVADVLTWQAGFNGKVREAVQKAHGQAHGKLAEEWGDEADANYEMARRTATAAFGDDGLTVLGLGEDPKTWPAAVVARMHDISPTFADSRHINLGGRDVGKTPDAMRAEAKELMESDKYRDGDEDTHQRVQKIFEGLHGTQAIGPGAGTSP